MLQVLKLHSGSFKELNRLGLIRNITSVGCLTRDQTAQLFIITAGHLVSNGLCDHVNSDEDHGAFVT